MQLARFRAHCPEGASRADQVEELVRSRPDCFARTCLPGHLTASAWILTPDRERCLLTHHRKIGRWLQLGGHADGQVLVHEVALREAREESGLEHFELVCPEGVLQPLDVDVHWIEAHGAEPGHFHHDIRYLLLATASTAIRRSDESDDLRWFPVAELGAITREESVLRLARLAARWNRR